MCLGVLLCGEQGRAKRFGLHMDIQHLENLTVDVMRTFKTLRILAPTCAVPCSLFRHGCSQCTDAGEVRAFSSFSLCQLRQWCAVTTLLHVYALAFQRCSLKCCMLFLCETGWYRAIDHSHDTGGCWCVSCEENCGVWVVNLLTLLVNTTKRCPINACPNPINSIAGFCSTCRCLV